MNDQPTYLYYTIGVGVICFIANGMVYFFPFREHLANENNLIGSILGSKRPHDHSRKGSQEGDMHSQKSQKAAPKVTTEDESTNILVD